MDAAATTTAVTAAIGAIAVGVLAVMGGATTATAAIGATAAGVLIAGKQNSLNGRPLAGPFRFVRLVLRRRLGQWQ